MGKPSDRPLLVGSRAAPRPRAGSAAVARRRRGGGRRLHGPQRRAHAGAGGAECRRAGEGPAGRGRVEPQWRHRQRKPPAQLRRHDPRLGAGAGEGRGGRGIRRAGRLARFIEDEGIDCDWKLTGRFTGAMRPKHYESMAAECELLNRHLDYGARMAPKAEQHAEVGSDLYHGGHGARGHWRTASGQVPPGDARRALEAGVAIHARTAVERLRTTAA